MPAQLDVSTKTAISVKHSGMPQNGSFLRAVDTHDAELLSSNVLTLKATSPGRSLPSTAPSCSTTTSDGHVDDERDPDEVVRLGLPGLVDEAAPLGGQKVSRGFRETVGHHVVGEVGLPLRGYLVV